MCKPATFLGPISLKTQLLCLEFILLDVLKYKAATAKQGWMSCDASSLWFHSRTGQEQPHFQLAPAQFPRKAHLPFFVEDNGKKDLLLSISECLDLSMESNACV
jgi:hypothetical protein